MENAILAILISNLFIYIFYRFFETTWPEEYFTENDEIGLVISITPQRFVLFRLLPVFICTSLIFSTFKVNGDWIQLGILGAFSALLHLAFTNGLALIKILRRSDSIKIFLNKGNQILYHILTIVVVLGIGAIAGIISRQSFFMLISPTRQGMIDNIWSSIIYSTVIIKAYRYYGTRKEKSIESIVNESMRQIRSNNALLETIIRASAKYNANPIIVEAVCIAENIQRPAWIRRLEYLLPKASYGIMQVKSTKKINDVDSVKLATKNFFHDSKYLVGESNFEKLILEYNNNSDYVKLVHKIIQEIDHEFYEKISSMYSG